jgi:cell division protein ZapA
MNKQAAKQIEVQIMGQSYLLACPPGGETALLDAVGKVDTAMCRIRDAGKVKARDRIAVLASLNLAFELSQRESELLAQTSFANSEPAPLGELGNHASTAPIDPSAQSRAEELIRRLDQTLGNDGQVL